MHKLATAAMTVGMAIATIPFALAQTNAPSPNEKVERFESDMAAAMEQMHHGMMAVTASGDPDQDFLAQMVPHHQGAVDMAKAVLLVTEDPQIRNLAQAIITEQQYEIELMTTLLAKTAGAANGTMEPMQ